MAHVQPSAQQLLGLTEAHSVVGFSGRFHVESQHWIQRPIPALLFCPSADSGDNPFYKNRPSTRVHAAPGGNSTIRFGDDIGDRTAVPNSRGTILLPKPTGNAPASDSGRTSVKVHQPPGGRSSSK
ncbi:uncharacterized protein LOC113147139 [Cyclospora cayetanensis]|uniref:Uncharacterized protein LOC113147139 n=1 Tax=Cyclospora cayetanensis TaxID=88456 RepID=A0A6P6RZ50_9EIME|nr:uncharacterized protein LOC113147139 [Cyclospora cayetanensis]